MATMESERSFQLLKALDLVMRGAVKRGIKLISKPICRIFALHHILQQIPGVQSAYIDLTPNATTPSYNNFVAGPPPDVPPSDEEKVKADVNNFVATSIYYGLWVDRARQIRSTGRREDCVGNLSVALNVGAAYSAGMTGANTVLSLIPTAGVLIGAPAKELWVL